MVWANAGTDWATDANWVGGTAPANSTVTDIASFGSGTAVNPNLSSQNGINEIVFPSGASAYNFSGSIITVVPRLLIKNPAMPSHRRTVPSPASKASTPNG